MNSPLLQLPARVTFSLLTVVLIVGCGREDVQVYRVAKDQLQPAMPAQNPMQSGQMPAGHPDVSGGVPPRLTWKTPGGWNEIVPGEFRVASFNIKNADGRQADVSVIPLPGGAGGDVANVNRWRGQVGLQALSPDELKKLAQSVEVAGQPAELYEQAGKNPSSGDDTRILAVIQHREGTAWFFKMTGDDKLVAEQKPTFVEFLKTLKFEAQTATALPPSHPPIGGDTLPDGHPPVEGGSLPAGHPDVSSPPATTASSPASDGKPRWTVPSGWKEAPAGQFLAAKFTVTGDGGAQAAINVSTSTGDGGGLTANVNRWRAQLGLSELSSDEIIKSVKTVEGTGGRISIVEMSGTDARSGQPAQVVGAIVPQSGQTWFYKLMGDARVVESQKESFTRFVQSVKY